MNIGIDCHYTHHKPRVNQYVISLLLSLKNAGYFRTRENRIFCYFNKKDDLINSFPEEVEIVISKSKSNALFEQIALPMEISKDKLDVFFSPYLLLPFFSFKKSIITIYDISFVKYPKESSWRNFFDNKYRKYLSKRAAKSARAIITPTEFTKKELMNLWGISEKKIHVLPLGGNINFHKTQLLNFPRQEFILFKGSILTRRFLPQIIKVFYAIAKNHPALRLMIIGKDLTNPPQNIDKLIENVNYNLIRKAITRFDRVSEQDMMTFYSQAKAFIYLSEYEGFCLSIIEAMNLGLPIIINKAKCLEEIAGNAALYVDSPNNEAELYTKLSRILTDSNLRQELKERGIRQAQKFSWQKSAKKTWEIIQSINNEK